MDGQEPVVRRDLNRDFLLNRYSRDVIAKAFQLVTAQNSPPEPFESSGQTARQHTPQPKLQETH